MPNQTYFAVVFFTGQGGLPYEPHSLGLGPDVGKSAGKYGETQQTWGVLIVSKT